MRLQILVIIIMAVGLLLMIGFSAAWLYNVKRFKNDPDMQESSADFINVDDIKDGYIFTRDGKAISIFRITPINIDLMTAAEKSDYIQKLSGYLSAVRQAYKILCVPRPFDVQPYISALEAQKYAATDIQNRIITEEIYALNALAKAGTIIEKNYYLVVWDDPDDIAKARSDLYKSWSDGGVQLTLLDQKELIKLCNLVFNPSFTTDEEVDITFPVLEEEET